MHSLILDRKSGRSFACKFGPFSRKTKIMKKKIHPRETLAVSSHVVLPNQTNVLGNLMGGELLNWMDVTGAIAGHRFCRYIVVTASVNNVSFDHPVRLGDVMTLEAKVSRGFTTSMEVFIDVWVEHHRTGERKKCNEAIYTYVALDEEGRITEVPELVPETEEEKERHEAALRRRQLSLILAGKMKPDEATELKALFG